MIPVLGSLAANPTVTRVLVALHGTDRDPLRYAKLGQAAAKKAGVAESTRVVAPWFQTKADRPAKGAPVWGSDSWKDGSGTPSSFAAMDELLALLIDGRFPNLTHLTLAGHSAGGQFVQRYAIFGRMYPAVPLNYVVANPSSYCYLSPQRFDKSRGEYRIPTGRCKTDVYKYGLQKRSGYVAGLPADQALDQYGLRRVTILNGSKDVTSSNDMDTSCAAMAQGSNRLLRGQYFHARYPSSTHDRVIVPGVGHDAAKMLAHPLAWPALFGVA